MAAANHEAGGNPGFTPAEAEIDRLRRTAENPLAKPSERVDARRRLADLGEVPARRLAGDDKRAALHVARRLLWDGMPD
ncbi:hypothetical protein [Acidiphilium sp.]|uniref:hypothetical protein n=1 Tax=Acidiphilium sp. TaxID=527 RepID=UPI003D08C54F